MGRQIVIGAGFSGLVAASVLAHKGEQVLLLEKQSTPGGRAAFLEKDGFGFDMGPSWYWMPEIFEEYFNIFGKSASDFYKLERLDPSYRIYHGQSDFMDVPADIDELYALFEKYEPGSSKNLKKFLADAKFKYDIGISEFVWKPGHSITEFFDLRIVTNALKMNILSSISSEIRKLFKHEKLIKILEFPVLFLGATPQNTPALYSLMNYADLVLGTWYPVGGMYEVVKAMVKICEEVGVKILYNQNVKSFEVKDNKIVKVITETNSFECDKVVGAADYHHIDQKIIAPEYQQYSKKYWDKRTMAPSSLLFYLGIDKKLKDVLHHNLFFDEDFDLHASEIYEDPKWPSKPLIYMSCASCTDEGVAPKNMENLVILMPIAPGLEDTEEIREKYYNIIMDRLEYLTQQEIRNHVISKSSFCINNFKEDYNSFRGNAYGLANTLTQTAFLKPKMKHKNLKNLYFAGQLTVPGPGVPPCIISGQMVAKEILK